MGFPLSLLNQNVKAIKPDGSLDLHDDTQLLMQMLGGVDPLPAKGGQVEAAQPSVPTVKGTSEIDNILNVGQGEGRSFSDLKSCCSGKSYPKQFNFANETKQVEKENVLVVWSKKTIFPICLGALREVGRCLRTSHRRLPRLPEI